MKELLQQLETTNSTKIKQEIDSLLRTGYIGICELRKGSLNHSLSLQDIEQIESLFNNNRIEMQGNDFQNRYFIKYVHCIRNFWNSNYQRLWQLSRGEYDLFSSLKIEDLHVRGYSETNFAQILNSMEKHWISSEQIYTKYQIDLMQQMACNIDR